MRTISKVDKSRFTSSWNEPAKFQWLPNRVSKSNQNTNPIKSGPSHRKALANYLPMLCCACAACASCKEQELTESQLLFEIQIMVLEQEGPQQMEALWKL